MVDLVGEASVTWEEYDTVTITAARLIFDGTSVGEESNVNATSAEIDPNPAVNLANRSNTIRMEIDLSIDVDGDEVVDYTRTYVSPRQVIYYHQSLLSVDATDQYTSEQQGDNSMLRQYWNSNWYDASPFDEEWTQTAYTCRYANKVGTTLWTYEAFSEEYAVYERSLFDYEAVPNGHSTSGTPDIDWVFQMAPRRRGLTAASAILNMSTGYPDQRLPQMGLINPYFGTNEADLGAYTVMGNVLWSSGAGSPPTQWYTTCSSLAAYQPTPLTSTAPHFEVPETGCPYLPSLGGYHYAFPNNDFCWFYVLVEDSFPNDDESLIPNYIYVESSPTPVEAGFSTDAGHPLLGPYGAYDWTEYDYEDPEAPRLFIQIRAGQSAGEGDFADDTDDTTSRNAVVGIDGSRWTLPPEEPGETIEIPLAVEYHWPEVHESPEDGAVTTGTKTVYAQKGIVVRVEVAQEIWAGESRPIYATLNGKYNDGGQTKTGDVPWTYPIEWQFAEPVWEEEGSGDDITYTPRPPETAEEYVPSQILTGAHRVKTDYSPLYVGDMTSSSGGLAYVRAVITGVSISSGKVVAGRGSETIVAAWVQVQSIEEVSAVDGAGDPVGEMALCMPEKVGGYTIYAYQDYAEAFALAFYEELDPSEADSITAGFMEQWETLEETGPGTLVFTDEESTIAVAFQNTPSLNEDECDVVEVVVTATAYGLSQRELELYEEDADSCSFVPKYLTVVLSAPGGLSESEKDSVHCVITCSHDPCEEITSTFTESAVASRVFLPPGAALDTFSVSGTGALDPLTAEELTLCFSMKTLNDYCGSVVVRETSADSRVFMSHLPVSVVLQEVPAVVDQGVCHATVRKWPGVVGQSTRIYLASSEECICLSAIASTSGTYQVEEDIVLLPTTTEINPDFYDDCPNGYRGVRVLKNMRDTLGGISLSREELEDRDGYIAALLTTYKKFMAIYEKQPDLIDLSDADSAVLTKFEKLLRPIALHGCAVVADPWISTRSNIHQDKIRKKLWGLGYCVIKESDITKARLKKLMQMENRFSKSIPNDQNLHLIDIWYFDAHGSSEGFKLDTRVKPEDLPQLESFRRLTFVNACWSGVSSVSDDGGSSTYGALHDATYAEAPGSTQDATVAAFQRKFNSVEYLGHPAVIGIRLKRGMAELLFTYAYKLPKGGRARPLVSQAVDAVNDEAATWGSNVNKKALARHVMEEYQGLADDWYRINRRLPTTQSKWDWWDE